MADPDHRSLMTSIDRLDITEGSARPYPQLRFAKSGAQHQFVLVHLSGNGIAQHDGSPSRATPTSDSVVDPASYRRRS